jgi:hypothetical protein
VQLPPKCSYRLSLQVCQGRACRTSKLQNLHCNKLDNRGRPPLARSLHTPVEIRDSSRRFLRDVVRARQANLCYNTHKGNRLAPESCDGAHGIIKSSTHERDERAQKTITAVINHSEAPASDVLRSLAPASCQPLQQPRDLHRTPTTVPRCGGHPAFIERRCNAP